MKRYNIAGIQFEIDTEENWVLDKFNMFLSLKDLEPDLKLKIVKSEEEIEQSGKILIQDEDTNISYSETEKRYYVHHFIEKKAFIISKLKINKNWNEGLIIFHNHHKEETIISINLLIETIFRMQILFHKGTPMHAAAIDFCGKGIVFTAPSGTGKSTQALLWKKHKAARILNDDRPLFKLEEDKIIVYGTPWGISPVECANDKVQLVSINFVEQASENKVIKLDKKEAVLLIMRMCFMPYFDSELMEIALVNVGNLIDRVPVYLLKCKADAEAVETVYECIK